ncbi:MAG TPA: error-prone DNA polymerase, partial [Burkholderiales bacterium]|nr:error-prone DNA polymerase [Burkholderiales bacterium]
YAPSQIVQDARRHGVEVRGVDVLASEWDCALEAGEAEGDRREAQLFTPSPLHPFTSSRSSPPAVRLGLRMVKGLSQAAAERIVAARKERMSHASSLTSHPSNEGPAPFEDVNDLARRAGLIRRDLECLAAAGALASLAGHRRAAFWQVTGIEPLPPILADTRFIEAPASLAAPTEGENLVADYATLGLTLGRHPLTLLRSRLRRMRLVTAAELNRLPRGSVAHTAGIVTCRQHPSTASGVTFVTIEDETGCVNVVVWRALAERQRRELLASRLMGIAGTIEREGEVVHLLAGKLFDHTALLGQLVTRSRDFH